MIILVTTPGTNDVRKVHRDALATIAKTSPGVQYMMMKDSEIISEVNLGFAELKSQRQVTRSTKFNANSVTKTITAIAVMKLIEEGKLRMSDSISKFFPAVPWRWNINIEQLLSHTSGLKNPIPLKWIHLQREHDIFDADAFVRDLVSTHYQQSNRPGESFAYSNLNYVILGSIIEQLSGKEYQMHIRHSILDPINSRLSFTVNADDDFASGYQKRFTLMSSLLGFFLDEKTFIARKAEGWLEFKPFYNNGAAYGGIIGNAKEFNVYLQHVMKDPSLLSGDSKQKMLTAPEGTRGKMTLSWWTGVLHGHRYFCHAGGGGGYYCEIRFYPELGVSSAIMLNRSGMTDERLLDKVDEAYILKLTPRPA